MATKGPKEDHAGEGQSSCNTETSDDWGDDEVVLLTESNISSESKLHKQRQEKSKPHVIMINKSCCQTVVSSGGSGHVQHVSVVGHVQQLGQQIDGVNNILGSETDEIPSKKKEKSTSFKITNVYLSRPPSNDGDDSGDDNEDLEDSHTEDLSDIIENLSSLALKDSGSSNTNGPQVLINTDRHKPVAQSSCDDSEIQSRKPSNVGIHRKQSMDKAWENSLPSYPHPGFGFVTYHQTGNTFHPVSYLDKTVSGAVAVFNSMECSGELSSSSQPVVVGPQDFKTRFKVVKVETTEPLKRGRWTCIDFTDKHSTPEVSKPVTMASNTTAVSKPATKTSEIPPSRPDSALPRDATEPVNPSDSSNPSEQQSTAKTDIELADCYPPHAGDEKETEVRGSSAGPEPGRHVSGTPSTGLHISLAQSQQTVPVITATPPVQSPHTANNNLPDFSSIQNSLGQVIRLNDGTLAQVALAPIPQQQQPIVKIIPNTTNQQIVHSQQVVVNAQGQHFLVSQQQQNLSQVPQQSQSQQQQSNRSQVAQQPPQSASPQQQLTNTRNQQQHQSLQSHQQSVRSQQNVAQQANTVTAVPLQQQNSAIQQNTVGQQQHQNQNIPGTQGVISNTTLPIAGVVLPQVTTTSGIVHQPLPTTSVTQQHTLTVRASTSIGQPGMVNSVVSSRVVSTSAQQQQSPVSHSLLMSSTIAPTPSSQAHLYNIPLGPPLGGIVQTNSLDSAFSAVNRAINMEDGNCLVERLEEMVSNRLADEHRDGELDESASSAGQGSIDHRIEQAMDLVKSHLMSAVRSEVEELRDKISKLEDTVSHLSRENEVLRANINPDVLTSLLGNRSIGGIPPDPSALPALPPSNQH